ncbi:DUF5060 domain-containing protein [bacterium]
MKPILKLWTRLNIILVLIIIACPLIAEIPNVNVASTNHDAVGVYEKFEVILELQDTNYDNPYDPKQIDIRAEFTAPSGKVWKLFGFYDNYQSADAWKVRFSPDEIGQWAYKMTASNSEGTGESPVYTFEVVQSDHHGWVHVSHDNPHYLEYDDGKQYYGVGAYLPWGNSVSRFDRLADYEGNFFAIWNINYNGMINQNQLIEEELGKYNQRKCGLIDSMIAISESRELIIQYCFWPHDLFSETVWAAQWRWNPYNQICDVDYVYSDSLCWEYQKQQYRYLIARFAYSRSWGIWEIMNEMNGTDGWAHGFTDDCYNWVSKVDAYFKANDPYRHPTTASFSGGYGEYRPELYWRSDMPNIHVYESQQWPTRFSNNELRSSLYNYADASLRFWENFNQPAQFGEAGYTATYFQPGEPEYTDLFHNSVWGSFINGLAITPVWWTLNELSSDELEHFSPFREFVDSIDLLHVSREPFRYTSAELNIMGMKSDSTAFGWIRDIPGINVSDKELRLNELFASDYLNFAMSTYNTWTGSMIDTQFVPQVAGYLIHQLPALNEPVPDIAFRLWPVEDGETGVVIQLTTLVDELLSINRDSSDILCAVLDEQGRLCPQSYDITFHINGPGVILGDEIQTTEQGVIHTYFHPIAGSGILQIIAESGGLESDTLEVQVMNELPIDDFESYQTNSEIQSSWVPQFNTIITATIETESVLSGNQSMRLDYTIGVSSPPYAFIRCFFPQRDMKYVKAFGFWLKADGSNRELEIRLQTDTRNYMKYKMHLEGTTKTYVLIPLDSFQLQSNLESIDYDKLNELQFKVNRGAGEYGISTITIDDIDFLMDTTMPSSVRRSHVRQPDQYQLFQNFPNPFNPSTTIQYQLGKQEHVQLIVYNIEGQEVSRLVDTEQVRGDYQISWDASHLPSGVYIYQFKAGPENRMRKCLLVK